jgi:hypothetical protein
MVFQPGDNALTPLRSFDNGDSWQELPAFPRNPDTGGANIFVLPNGSVYAFCYGSASVVYALGNGATRWQVVASLPVGEPLTVQYDANGREVALWAHARQPGGNGVMPGLAYYPLTDIAP